jgi:hypothetical protein
MRISFAIVLIIIIAAFAAMLPAEAQQETPQAELYGGYNYVHFSVKANVVGFPASATFNANGGSGQLEINANRWLGIVGDLGGYYVAPPSQAGALSYLFGPRLNLRKKRITPFAQALFGGTVATGGIGQVGAQNAFATTAGGGLDIRVSNLVAIRPVQAEYFMTKFADGLNNRQNNFRFGAGIVFRLGQK